MQFSRSGFSGQNPHPGLRHIASGRIGVGSHFCSLRPLLAGKTDILRVVSAPHGQALCQPAEGHHGFLSQSALSVPHLRAASSPRGRPFRHQIVFLPAGESQRPFAAPTQLDAAHSKLRHAGRQVSMNLPYGFCSRSTRRPIRGRGWRSRGFGRLPVRSS